jgi:hypothetical protein
MRAYELNEFVSPPQMAEIAHFCDALWGKLGIDVAFTRHFIDRVNDERNGKSITTAEMIRLFRKEYEQFGKQVASMDANQEAVFSDILTNVNLPFVIKGDGEDKTLVAKTVMRKPDFKTPDPLLKVK